MHAVTRFKTYPFSAQKTAESFAALIQHTQGRYLVLVAHKTHQQLVGALVGVIEQQIFSHANVASIMHIDVLPEARMGGYALRLLRAFEVWATNRDVIEMTFGINSTSDSAALERFALKLGYQKVGGNFAK
jgi:L-amino acid N-acyltransferase YncA